MFMSNFVEHTNTAISETNGTVFLPAFIFMTIFANMCIPMIFQAAIVAVLFDTQFYTAKSLTFRR
jgi:hypothetical protein